MNTQERYWQEFIDIKADAIYFDLYYSKTEQIDRSIKIIMAIASSSSIGAWVIWRNLDFLWGFIIAFSQVINAIKDYLPYKNRLTALSGLSKDINGLAISAEHDWFKVIKGALTEEEINELQMKLKKDKLNFVQKHFPDGSLPESAKLVARADERTKKYLENYFRS